MNIIRKPENDDMIVDIQNRQRLCTQLMQSPHYRKIGAEGVFAIVEKAKSMGANALDCLNGGMYYVQGKVEMTSQMMNQMIRMNGHSITKDKRSDDKICILHGKRADNGDTWTESFSIDDAKLAGIYRNQWLKYPKDMLFARALSRLARQLFPDVIKGCYVQGEISDAIEVENREKEEKDIPELSPITEEQYTILDEAIGQNHSLRANILRFMQQKWGLSLMKEMPSIVYEQVLNRVLAQRDHQEEANGTE